MASPRLALASSPAPLSLRLEVIAQQTEKPSPKFNPAFIERRMRQHRALQSAMERDLTAAIFSEVASVLGVRK